MDKQMYLKLIDEVIEQGVFKDEWRSLCNYETAKWYKKAKFGIFIHWGVYTVPEYYDEWYPRRMYREGSEAYNHQIETYGPLSEFGYKDFIPMFKAEKFDPNEWADLFKAAGAKFVMPVAEHHDGFQMYASDLSQWNSAEMGPKRDVLGELKTTIEERDMVFAASSHRAEHWWFFNTARNLAYDVDVKDEKLESFYGPAAQPTLDFHSIYENPPSVEYMEDWLARSCELVDKYQPKVVFFDWWIQQVKFKPFLRKFAAYYYNRSIEWGVEVVINSKFDAFVHGSVVKDIERGQMNSIQADVWQNDTSVAKNSWSYTIGNDYKESNEIICDLVDVVSKNGCLLLNVGPRADGSIDDKDKKILLDVGEWLNVNGEAIYDTIPWKIYGEGPTEVPEGSFTDVDRQSFTSKDLRFTAKGNAIYVTVLNWPDDGYIVIDALSKSSPHFKSVVKEVEILGEKNRPKIENREKFGIRGNIGIKNRPVVVKFIIE